MEATSLRQCTFGPIVVDYDNRVLTPRPWTFAQSDWAAELAKEVGVDLMLELYAGAGQIGLAAAVLAGADLVQVEADPVAAGYALRNADTAGWSQRTEVRAAEVLAALAPEERFELIIADPPYLPTSAITGWPEDPVTAIDGGPDGLGPARECLTVAAVHLAVAGKLLLQVAGAGQAAQIAADLPAALAVIEVRTIDDDRAVMRVDRSWPAPAAR